MWYWEWNGMGREKENEAAWARRHNLSIASQLIHTLHVCQSKRKEVGRTRSARSNFEYTTFIIIIIWIFATEHCVVCTFSRWYLGLARAKIRSEYCLCVCHFSSSCSASRLVCARDCFLFQFFIGRSRVECTAFADENNKQMIFNWKPTISFFFSCIFGVGYAEMLTFDRKTSISRESQFKCK